MGVWYATREQLKSALDFKETARNNGQMDRALESSSRSVEKEFHRPNFYPLSATRTFDWPRQYARPWRLWLNQHELISATTVTAGGVTISSADYLLRPDDGPPFTHVELDLSSSATFSGGSTHQRAISIVGVFGYANDETPAGALAEGLDASETGVDGTNAAAIGVGDLIRCESERMIVTGRQSLDTGQNIGANLAALNTATSVTVSDGTGYTVGEVILVDSEKMLVVDIASNTLIVRRAWDGTVLAAHTTGADVFADRTLTVTRGAAGTTAATHDTATALTRYVPPGPVTQYTLALAINQILQESAGYARTIGSAENEREAAGRGLRSARAEAWIGYGRKSRIRGV